MHGALLMENMHKKCDRLHNRSRLASRVIAALFVLASGFSVAAVTDREQAKFIHDRLTGVLPTDEMLDLMESRIANNNDPVTAARYAIDGAASQLDAYGSVIAPSGGFYNALLKNWASPWTNEAQDIFEPLNDYSATVIGLIRDGEDFRKILYDNVIYTGAGGGLAPYSATDNDHYQQLEASSSDMGDPAVLVRSPQSSVTGLPVAGVAGVMTTRAAAKAYFVDGTNRAMFRFTVLNHLCNDLEQYKDNALPTDLIRQDVSRSPGGDSSIFLNECSACHTGMDPMAQAFAYHHYQYPSEQDQPGLTEEQRQAIGRMVYTPGVVQPKHLQNEGNFREGYITPDDHWINYWRTGPNAQKIGWAPTVSTSPIDRAINPAYSEGDGAASLGQELANTEAFAYCQVKKAFQAVCLREPQAGADDTAFETIVSDFKTGGYDMKRAFIDIAVHCSDHLNP